MGKYNKYFTMMNMSLVSSQYYRSCFVITQADLLMGK